MIIRIFALLAIAFAASLVGVAQSSNEFRGTWQWASYPTSRSELPPAMRNEPLREVPRASLTLSLSQNGNKVTGEYSGSARYLARLEDGELDGLIKGQTLTLELTSSFGGNLTVELRRAGQRLHWKVIKSEGQAYFPQDVFMRRTSRKPRKLSPDN